LLAVAEMKKKQFVFRATAVNDKLKLKKRLHTLKDNFERFLLRKAQLHASKIRIRVAAVRIRLPS
jgi:hypothetical protein